MKPMAPGSIFHHISFQSTILLSFISRSINQKTQKYLLYLLFSFIYLYQILPLQVTVKGLTTPLSRWVQVFNCLSRCVDRRLVRTSYWIDTLVLKLRETLIFTLLHHPFLVKGKTNASSRSRRRSPKACPPLVHSSDYFLFS